MGKILEIREISFAVKDFNRVYEKFKKMGFSMTPVHEDPQPPIQAKWTSMPIGSSSLSFMSSIEDGSPIDRFLQKRGEGLFSFTLLVDNIEEIMEKWSEAGVQWVLEKPIEVRNGYSVGQRIPVLRGNWTRPSTLHGLVIELQEFRDENGNPYTPPGGPEIEN